MQLHEVVDRFFKKKSRYLYGFSDLTGLLDAKYSPFTHAIVIAERLSDRIVNGIVDGPTLEYYEHYRSVNDDLLDVMLELSEHLIEHEVRHRIISPTLSDEEMDEDYRKKLEYSFSHKMAATRAGLGWIGKTDLFVSRKYGPRVRLATILTDTKLPQQQAPVERSDCGECSVCVNACPAHAASGKLWNVNVHRNDFFDPVKCMEKCREQSDRNFGKMVSVCGICISVCPVGRKQHN